MRCLTTTTSHHYTHKLLVALYKLPMVRSEHVRAFLNGNQDPLLMVNSIKKITKCSVDIFTYCNWQAGSEYLPLDNTSFENLLSEIMRFFMIKYWRFLNQWFNDNSLIVVNWISLDNNKFLSCFIPLKIILHSRSFGKLNGFWRRSFIFPRILNLSWWGSSFSIIY